MLAAPLVACMTVAASINGLPALLLPAIHVLEGGQIGTIAKNANGTEDCGVMQINSSWLPTLASGLGRTESEVRWDLIHNGCFNIQSAGVVMKYNLGQAHGDLWQAV